MTQLRRHSLWAALLTLLFVCSAWGQNKSSEATIVENGITFGNSNTAQWRVGVVVQTVKGPMKSVIATVPVPIAWPEQTVKLVSEDVTPGVEVGKRDHEGVRQLLIRMPGVRGGKTARALFTYEITRREIVGPTETSDFSIPKKATRKIKRWLNGSPYIDHRNGKIRSLARGAIKEVEGDWEKVEAIYDLVREKVEYKEGKLKSATQALRDGSGDCEELTSLFIAMCRAVKVPARMVWIPDHCYPEFYLLDKEGKGHWFPCQAAGTRAFGSMPEIRPILQKGDNYSVAEKSKPQRYVAEYVSAKPVRGSGQPKVSFIREFVQPDG